MTADPSSPDHVCPSRSGRPSYPCNCYQYEAQQRMEDELRLYGDQNADLREEVERLRIVVEAARAWWDGAHPCRAGWDGAGGCKACYGLMVALDQMDPS